MKFRNFTIVIFLATVAVITIYVANILLRTSLENRSSASAGNTFYVSVSGSDTNPGTQSSPFRTINYGRRFLQPGDTLLIDSGTYNERVDLANLGTSLGPVSVAAVSNANVVIDGTGLDQPTVALTGNYITLSGVKVINSSGSCVNVKGTYNIVRNLTVTGCQTHGIQAMGQHLRVENNTVYKTNISNSAKLSTSGWGSALKAYIGADDVVFTGNTVYDNYGEGIGVTRGTNIVVSNNFFYDNYSVNIYIDNSYNVLVDGNLSSCTGETEYLRSGNRPAGIALGEENYTGWGAQLHDVTVSNNIVAFCRFGMAYFSAEVAGGGMVNVKIANNTFWNGNYTALYFGADPNTGNTVVENNIFSNDGTRGICWLDSPTGITLRHNLWVNGEPAAATNCAGQNDRVGNPQFALSPIYNSADTFRITASSPAVDMGINNGISKDYWGIARPQGTRIDIGAHEFSTMSSPAPAASPMMTATPSPTPVASPISISNSDPVITTSSLAVGTVNKKYQTKIAGSDTNAADILNLSISGLPSGIAVSTCARSSSGSALITCTVKGIPTSAGLFTVIATITDNHNGTSQKIFTLKIK